MSIDHNKMAKQNQAPNPRDLLYRGLFENSQNQQVIPKLADGIKAIFQNVTNLIEDMKYLAVAERYSVASFLLSTASEEIAKIYLLLDACKLNFEKHDNTTKRLCSAFYDHIKKHAYIEVMDMFDLPHNRDMNELQKIWDINTQKWWPADFESGEPDMPHDTVFDRQWPLYVEFDSYARVWHRPDNSKRKFQFAFLGAGEVELENPKPHSSNFAKLLQNYERVAFSNSIGIFSQEVLQITYEIFSQKYLSKQTPTNEIILLYEAFASRLTNEFGITEEQLMRSSLAMWPLYDFV